MLIGFSLNSWMLSRSIASTTAFTEAQADDLYMELGLDHFMAASEQCSSSDRIYNGTVDGWSKGQGPNENPSVVVISCKTSLITTEFCIIPCIFVLDDFKCLTLKFLRQCVIFLACVSSVPVLPAIVDSVCHLKADCNSVECCTEVPFLRKTFRTSVTLDPCNFLLTVNIERMTREITLTGYSWGLLTAHIYSY